MKKILLFLIIIFYFTSIFATRIDTTLAYRVAQNFLIEHQNSTKSISLKLINDNSKSSDLLYIFDINNSKGFIIVSANDKFLPVLAFSDESAFSNSDSKPDAYYEWLDNVENQMKYVLDNKIKTPKEVKNKWTYYSNKKFSPKKGIKSVSPLLTTTWDQGQYYNTLCPVCSSGGSGGHVWAGCVAASMAQVMNYWNYPDYGSAEHSYNHSTYGLQYADFANTNYDWASMPNSVTSNNLAVATLMYHCGVAVNMNYAPSGSGAYMSNAANALKNYFDYSKDLKIISKYSYTSSQWDSLIMLQIDKGQPLSYSGGNHAFNVDGYKDSCFFHLNWGWGGSYNGYFYLSDLTPGSSDFTSGQQAIINIRPNCGEASTIIDTIFDYSGTFFDNGGSNSNYINCSESKVLIAPENATNILLSFSYLNIATGDFLNIYDGNDESAPLLYSLSGENIPANILSSSGKVYLKFVSNNFTTERGYQIDFTSSFNDAGITQMLLPISKTCGKSADSLLVVVKNFGINSQNTIPVEIKVQTPHGIETYNSVCNSTLQRNQIDTLFVGYINTEDPGEYSFNCYTKLSGDNLINKNDSIKKVVIIKSPKFLPYFENVDSLNWQMGDWKDFYYRTWINADYGGLGKGGNGHAGNNFFSTHVSKDNNQFFVYDRKIENITQKSGVFFDYRILNTQSWPPTPATLNTIDKIEVIVSDDCGDNYQTIFTIDNTNHHPDSLFQRLYISLKDYAGKKIIFGFRTFWDSGNTEIDYDNILFVDSLQNVLIDQTNACSGKSLTIVGANPQGGIGEYVYIWQQSSDANIWTDALGTNNQKDYFTDVYNSALYFRRIVADSMYYCDTSQTILVEIQSCSALNEQDLKINLYPNPTSNRFIVQGIDNNKFNRLEIDNIQGQKMYYSDKFRISEIIDISSFEKGIYIVKIISDDEVVVRRLVKN